MRLLPLILLITLAGPRAADVNSTVVELTNRERVAARLPALRVNDRLAEAAELHAVQIAEARRLAHVLPGARYPKPTDRLDEADYRWRTYGENLAHGQRTAKDAVGGWMRSKGHRANILNGKFTEIGVGHAVDRNGRVYYVQMFGTPR